MFPNYDIRRDSVLAIIKEDNPIQEKSVQGARKRSNPKFLNIHSIRIHRLAGVKVQISEIWHNVLGVVSLDARLERLDLCIIRTILLELLNNLLQVS